MFRKTILLAVSVLLAVGLAACGEENNPAHNSTNPMDLIEVENITEENSYQLELRNGINAKTAENLLEKLPYAALASAELIIVDYSPLAEGKSYLVLVAWHTREHTQSKIWEITMDKVALEPLFTLHVENDNSGSVFIGHDTGTEFMSIVQGELIEYDFDAKVNTIEMCEVVAYINDFICPIVSFHPFGAGLCALTSIIASLLC